MMISWQDWSLIYLILVVGASLQGLIGFGLGLFSAPILFLLAPVLVPVPMILNSLVITLVLLFANRQFIDKQFAPFSILGGSVGVLIATAVMTLINVDHYQVVFGFSIVTAAILSAAGYIPQVSNFTSVIAGTISGFMGTLTSAGGAPMGLLYQAVDQEKLKANLSLFFVYINTISLLSLGAAGIVTSQDCWLFLYSFPPVMGGWLISLYLKRYMNINVIRPLILFIAMCSGLVCMFN